TPSITRPACAVPRTRRPGANWTSIRAGWSGSRWPEPKAKPAPIAKRSATNGSQGCRQEPEFCLSGQRAETMERKLRSLIIASLPFGSVLADAPQAKNAKVTLVYQHELPNMPGKSIKGVLVEYGPGGYSPGHTHAKSAFIYATVLEGAIRSQVNDGPVAT